MFVFFEHKHPCALGHHEAIAIFGERSRPFLRELVPLLSQDPHEDEAPYCSQRNRSIGPTGQHPIQPPGFNLPHRVVHRVSRRRSTSVHHFASPLPPNPPLPVPAAEPHT